MKPYVKVILGVSGVGLIAYALYNYAKKQEALLEQYSWKLVGIHILKLTTKEVALNLTIRFTSVSDLEAEISKVYLDMLANGSDVGYITETAPFILPANGSTDVNLTITFIPKDILKNAIDIALGIINNKAFTLSGIGYAEIKSGFVRLTLPVQFDKEVALSKTRREGSPLPNEKAV